MAAAAGLSPADLIQLRDELTSHPRSEAELQRVLAFLSFQRQWDRFDELRRSGASAATLQPLARELDAALAQRWENGEVSGAQALQLKALLLEHLLDDAQSRRLALGQWQAQAGIGTTLVSAQRPNTASPAQGAPR
ncbi:MAG: hypothetical protein JNJ71_18075 [Rubrivivax sp.]|nr:hypothetical protein [Rubrivivax sp.]